MQNIGENFCTIQKKAVPLLQILLLKVKQICRKNHHDHAAYSADFSG
jgi:hypothetical protein